MLRSRVVVVVVLLVLCVVDVVTDIGHAATCSSCCLSSLWSQADADNIIDNIIDNNNIDNNNSIDNNNNDGQQQQMACALSCLCTTIAVAAGIAQALLLPPAVTTVAPKRRQQLDRLASPARPSPSRQRHQQQRRPWTLLHQALSLRQCLVALRLHSVLDLYTALTSASTAAPTAAPSRSSIASSSSWSSSSSSSRALSTTSSFGALNPYSLRADVLAFDALAKALPVLLCQCVLLSLPASPVASPQQNSNSHTLRHLLPYLSLAFSLYSIVAAVVAYEGGQTLAKIMVMGRLPLSRRIALYVLRYSELSAIVSLATILVFLPWRLAISVIAVHLIPTLPFVRTVYRCCRSSAHRTVADTPTTPLTSRPTTAPPPPPSSSPLASAYSHQPTTTTTATATTTASSPLSPLAARVPPSPHALASPLSLRSPRHRHGRRRPPMRRLSFGHDQLMQQLQQRLHQHQGGAREEEVESSMGGIVESGGEDGDGHGRHSSSRDNDDDDDDDDDDGTTERDVDESAHSRVQKYAAPHNGATPQHKHHQWRQHQQHQQQHELARLPMWWCYLVAMVYWDVRSPDGHKQLVQPQQYYGVRTVTYALVCALLLLFSPAENSAVHPSTPPPITRVFVASVVVLAVAWIPTRLWHWSNLVPRRRIAQDVGDRSPLHSPSVAVLHHQQSLISELHQRQSAAASRLASPRVPSSLRRVDAGHAREIGRDGGGGGGGGGGGDHRHDHGGGDSSRISGNGGARTYDGGSVANRSVMSARVEAGTPCSPSPSQNDSIRRYQASVESAQAMRQRRVAASGGGGVGGGARGTPLRLLSSPLVRSRQGSPLVASLLGRRPAGTPNTNANSNSNANATPNTTTTATTTMIANAFDSSYPSTPTRPHTHARSAFTVPSPRATHIPRAGDGVDRKQKPVFDWDAVDVTRGGGDDGHSCRQGDVVHGAGVGVGEEHSANTPNPTQQQHQWPRPEVRGSGGRMSMRAAATAATSPPVNTTPKRVATATVPSSSSSSLAAAGVAAAGTTTTSSPLAYMEQGRRHYALPERKPRHDAPKTFFTRTLGPAL